MTTTNKKILVLSIFTFAFAAAIFDSFSRPFWKKTRTKKKIQLIKEEEEEEKPNPESATADRISELPIEILHRILGFLDMEEVLQTSLVSTKWRYLWKSVPTLKFSHRRSGFSAFNVEKYHNFVDCVLRLRDSEASKIQIFSYFWDYGLRDYNTTNLEWLHNFIVTAVNQGAQKIQIRGFHLDQRTDMIHFNPSIFTSGVLRRFTFAIFYCHFLIQFPRSMCCSTQLTHLTLHNIRLPEGDDESNSQLHLVCPVLEQLDMYNCYVKHLKVLDISAPKLNTLSIKNAGVRNGAHDGLGGCRIEIRTPNLTSLDYVGSVYDNCFTENLPRLADASLGFIIETSMLVEETTSFTIKLLKGLTAAESLTLGV